MPLIDTTTLLRVADRAAYQYGQIQDTMEAISQEGLGYYFATVTTTEDPDVELPTEPPYHLVDEDLETHKAVQDGTLLANIVTGMEAHFNVRDSGGIPLQLGGWDGYLSDEDERVSYYFAQLFFVVHGFYMLAINAFSESDDDFADVEVIAGPTIQFTDGTNYGDGSQANPANGTYYAATQLKVSVVTFGASDLDLRLSVKDKNDSPTTIDVTIPAGSAPGAEVSVGGTSDRFLDVIGVAFVPAGSTGTVGDEVKIKNLKERQIQL